MRYALTRRAASAITASVSGAMSTVIAPGTKGGAVEYIPGYDGQLHLGPLAWLVIRLVGSLYLLASALAQFDRTALPLWEVFLRLAAAAALLAADPLIYGAGIVAFVVLVGRQIAATRPATPQVALAKSHPDRTTGAGRGDDREGG